VLVTEPAVTTARRWILPLAYAAVYLGWGTTYLAIRVAVQSMGPATYMGLRFALASLALLPVLLIGRSFKGTTLPQYAHSALQGVLLLVGGLLPLSYAEKSIPSNVAAIIIGCAPAAFAIFDRLLNGTAIRKPVVIGFFFGISGIALLSLGGSEHQAGLTGVTPFGLALVIGGCFTWSFASVFSKKLRPVQAPLLHVFVQYMAAGAVYLAIAFGFEGLSLSTLSTCSPGAWQSLVYIALLPSLVSYTAFMWLLKHEPTSRVSTYAFVNPVVAVIAGALILHEAASPIVVGALLLVITGTWFNFRKARPTRAAK
jgi:drug/metabolite transporter (DMT)-like permease